MYFPSLANRAEKNVGLYKEKRALIVEDDKQILKVMQRLFQKAGYHVFTAESGEEALEVYDRNKKIHVVVTDYHLASEMSSLELLQEIKKTKNAPPVFFVTGLFTQDVVDKLEKNGVAGIFSKPPLYNHLFKSIKNVLDKQK